MTVLRRRIVGIYRELKSLPSLRPGRRVNGLFSELVDLTLSSEAGLARRVLADPGVRAIRADLQKLCALGEFELETHWSDRVAAARDPWKELERFPYYQNYVQAARIEANCLFSVKRHFIRRVLFVGAGPLPLTSVCLAREHMVRIDNVEIDEPAFERGKRLAARLGLSHRLRFYRCDIMDFSAPRAYDAVFLASLVGADGPQKVRMLRRVSGMLARGAILVVRSAQRLRSLVYPSVDMDMLRGFAPLLEIHPHNEVMNSNLVVRKR